MEQHFRGVVSCTGDVSAAIIIHTGSKTTVVELSEAVENAWNGCLDKDCPNRKRAEQAAEERFGIFDL